MRGNMDERIKTLIEFFKLHDGDATGYRFKDFRLLEPKKGNRKRKIKNPVKGTRLVKL
jgi:hypothetical protein